MKQFILITMLAIASTEVVKPTTETICTCDKIMSEPDCKNAPTCAWTAAVAATDTTASVAGFCGVQTIPTTPPVAQAHCAQITEPETNCWKTTGCAYVDSKCTHFTGCTAYAKATNQECLTISRLCITNGTQCTEAKSCNEYTEEVQCNTNPSISGIYKCKWDNNSCRDYNCSEADSTLNTDEQCITWQSKCLKSTGKGCTTALEDCASYFGDDVSCSGLKGTDGNCEGIVGGTNCTARICSKASITLVTDDDCGLYQTNCITNGKGCLAKPLPACAFYLGDKASCVGYIGSDGICEGDEGATNCRARKCINAPPSNNTNALCDAYKTGCVTNGKGCADSKSPCSGYSGTTSSCSGYIGSDGYCEGTNDTTNSPCAAKVCTEAATTITTDSGCALYQIGCKTTGKGCIIILGLCSSYQGTTTTCDGYIGSDGKCKGTTIDTPGPCSLRICTDAPSSTNTNQACADFQNGCVTNGAGCINQVSCSNTIKEISCTGTDRCGWNSNCVASQNCSDFQTVSICNGNNAISGTTSTPCFWTGSQCRNLACTDAPNTHNSDFLCDKFLAGCLTKGNGCLDPSAPCSSYFGDKAACFGFTRKCINTPTAASTASCIDRVCTDDITSTTDSACNSFKSGCRTKGTGCIEPTKLCSDYSGIQSVCDGFKGNNGTTRCWGLSQTTSSACKDKACSDLASAPSDSECQAFLGECLFNGVGCVLKTSDCTSYIGTQSQCNKFKGSNKTKTCWSTNTSSQGACVEKTCDHAPSTMKSNTECGDFLEGCVTNGGGCILSTSPCSSYSGTLKQCSAFTGNSKKCYNKDKCTDRVCSDKSSGVADNNECTTYLSSCRYMNGGCVDADACFNYAGDSLAKCQDLLDNSVTPKKCWWSNGTTCIPRTCANAPTVTNQTDCTNHLSICVYNGSICLDSNTCSSYIAFGGDTAAKQLNCGAMKSSSGTYCASSGGYTCEDKSCSNVPSPNGQTSCDTHMGDTTSSSCRWNGIACVLPNSCSNYTPTGANDAAKLAICQSMKDNSATPVSCYFQNGISTCVYKSCTNAPSPTDQTSCDNHISGCSWNGTSCLVAGPCNSYTPIGADDSAKKSFCKSMKNNSTPAQYCTFSSGYDKCVERVCELAESQNNQTDCSNWIAKCQFNGKYCESPSTCSTHFGYGANDAAKTTSCKALTTSDNPGIPCGFTSGITPTVCQPKICSNKIDATFSSACMLYMSTCKYVGSSICVDPKADCSQYTPIGTDESAKRTICDTLSTTTKQNCSLLSGANVCSNRTCAGKVAPTNQSACNSYLAGCKFISTSVPCIEPNNSCTYTPTGTTNAEKRTYCETLGCQYLDGGQTCNAKTCAGKYSPSVVGDCTTWISTCRLSGGVCVDVNTTCNYSAVGANDTDKLAYCKTLTNKSGGRCGFVNGQDICSTPLACSSLTNPANEIACQGVQYYCTWINSSTPCVDNLDTCNFITPISTTMAMRLSSCKMYETSTGVGCTYGTYNTHCTLPKSDCAYPVGSSWTLTEKKTSCESLGCVLLVDTDTTCSIRTCTSRKSPTSSTHCESWKSGCIWVSGFPTCVDPSPDCSYTVIASESLKKLYCSFLKSSLGVGCTLRPGDTSCSLAVDSCAYPYTTIAECEYIRNPDGQVCTYIPGSTTCSTRQCHHKKDAADSNACQSYLESCELASTAVSACSDRTCTNASPSASNSDCTGYKSSCRFKGDACIDASPTCDYTLAGTIASGTEAQKIEFCQTLDNGADPALKCTFVTATSSTACILRTCTNISTIPTSYDNCTTWMSTCTYNGTTCLNVDACSNYTASGADDAAKITYCKAMKNTSGVFCGFSIGQSNCSDRQCSNAPTPSSDSDCLTYQTGCTIFNAVPAICVDITTSCSQYTGLPDQCQQLIANGIKCWSALGASTTIPAACKVRECSDNTTSITHEDCNTFLSGCKTNWAGCISNSVPCSSFLGNESTCVNFKDSTGINFCKVGVSSTDPCNDKACSDDASSTTDALCQSFMPGCLTKGIGCIDSTEPCSKYQGTQSICKNFVGAGKKCWNPASVTVTSTFCMDKKCSDDTTSNTDANCDISVKGCLTKGSGCIDKSAPCQSYQGTQSICSAFKGSNKTKLCWNSPTASQNTPCTEKACTDNTTATSDADCEAFIPKDPGATDPKCVTSGTGCVGYPRTCSQFTGTLEQCGKFTATDGPCKTTVIGNISASGTCTPKICSEALNSNNTDELCKAYHPTCVTNGYGCVSTVGSSVGCSSFQEKNSCAAKVGCSWVNNCRTNVTDCSTLTSLGASLCVNTSVQTGSKKCSWYNSACRAQSCHDLSATLVTHDSCQSSISTCTTTGSGCITIGACNTYVTEIICKAAKTTQSGDTCIWDNNACRAKKCTDAPTGITTDVGCNTYLTGCKTNGTSCLASVTCPTLLTAAACQVDGSNKPCLYVNNTCYSYAKCEDVTMNTHSDCQQFSPLCTTEGTKCIAITSCALTALQVSCVVGTDGTCGWLPANGADAAKCQKFGACSDAVGTDDASCNAYGSNCITDGTKCIEKGTCSTYLTPLSCNYGGTDGACQFITESNSCRLRECSDATTTNASEITSHSGCYGFSAKTKCTTNGTSCIALADCVSYTLEEGCVEGTDGICIYELPLGQTTGTKACRLKACGDFPLATSASCSTALTGVGVGTGCVSDGTNCIVKAACSTYSSKEACNGGGSDGICAYTPGSTETPNVGTCKLMSTCTDANNDQIACRTNSSACDWQVLTSDTTTTTTCSAYTCATKALGSSCNPVPSFDGKSFTICGLDSNGVCIELTGVLLSATTCQSNTLYTYTWDEKTSKCTACFTTSGTTTDPGNNQIGNTATDGNMIKSITTLAILAILVG